MLVDTHSHLHFPKYNEDRSEVHARMAEFDVKTITIGTAITTSRSAVAYAEERTDTWASVGYHPEHVTSDYEDEDEKGALDEPYSITELEKLITSPRVLAVGECGLDYHYFSSEQPPSAKGESKGDLSQMKADQLAVFNEQAELAVKYQKALIVHSRDAGEDMVQAIANLRDKFPNLQIVIHGFSDAWEFAKAYLDLNCYLGIGGIVTFKPRKNTAEEDILANIVKKMPLEQLLLETDCPWLAPVPVRGQRNEPAHVRHIAKFIADLQGLSLEKMSQITTENATKCFNCDFTS
ncbi:YchF/TatD family DNA exonuclease [Candidatus Uhrbacteria bacterium]|nr:YchF/TatD family DNA exonuclease [Candidatus Uhrbacteria bacterium]